MPSKNTVKQYDSPAYYHVYNRGAGGQLIFKDAADNAKFLSLLERHLSNNYADEHPEQINKRFDVEVIAYCLMNNHFHLLLYQDDSPDQISLLMRSVSTAYSMYFNKKYKSQGHLFQSVFRASMIDNESYLLHITRYIHMNPRTYATCKWSSLPYYIGQKQVDWVNPHRLLDMTPVQYSEFLHEYEGKREELKKIKHMLAA